MPPPPSTTFPTTTGLSTEQGENKRSLFVPDPEIFFWQKKQLEFWKAGVLGALNFAAQVLAARLIVLVAVLGAIALAWLCLPGLDLTRVGLLAVYCAGVLLPVVWLSLSVR